MGMEGNYPTGVNDNVIHEHFGGDDDAELEYQEVVGNLIEEFKQYESTLKSRHCTPLPTFHRRALERLKRAVQAVEDWSQDSDDEPLYDPREERDA